MHTTNMFNRPAGGVAIEMYDLQQLAPQFANWNFGLGNPYDQLTPQICLMTIQEIQARAAQGHPIRVGMFNIVSENAFNNALFQDLVQTIITRVGYGMQGGEFRSLDMAAKECIARGVKCCGSAMAAEDPEFMASLNPRDAADVRENAEIWNYLLALAQGQAQYVPFAQMGGSGGGLTGVSGTTQQAMQAARGITGGYVEAPQQFEGGVTTTAYNNNASRAGGRYGRRAEKLLGKLEGSLQGALHDTGLSGAQVSLDRPDPTPTDTGYRSRIRKHMVTQAPVDQNAAEAARQFDANVTNFSAPVQPVSAPAEVKPAKPMFSVQIENEAVDVMRQVKDGVQKWKPSRLQRFHPAWCARTHKVLYFETRDGLIVAMLQPLTEEQKENAMNYDAHAIDPTKGQPDPEAIQKPVRKEAAVLYTDSKNVKINITVADHYSTEEDVSGAIRTTRLTAEMSEKVPDAFVNMSVVNSPVVYGSAEDANDDMIVINAIAGSKDFAEAASYISKIRSDLARKTINDVLVQAINRATECELGVGVRISDFAEDGPQIIDVLERTQGALVGEKMRANQTLLLKSNIKVVAATEMTAYANATLATGDVEELPESVLARVLFLQRFVCAVWVNFTDDELAIGMPPKGPATIQGDSLGALYEIARSTFTEAINTKHFSEQFLVTKDNVRYRLHRGLLNRDCFLLSKEVKAA